MKVLDPIDQEIIESLVISYLEQRLDGPRWDTKQKNIFVGKVYEYLLEHEQADKINEVLNAINYNLSRENLRRAIQILSPIKKEFTDELVFQHFEKELKGRYETRDEKYLLIGKVWNILSFYKQENKMNTFLTALTECITEE